MTFSLNEIETMGKRAACGAGLSFGLAEEAGKATRWLTTHHLPGAQILCEILRLNDGVCYDELAPVATNGEWRAPGGALCPLIAGPALSDRAADIAAGHGFALVKTTKPIMLLSYLAAAAESRDLSIEVSWPDARAVVSAKGMLLEGENLAASSAKSVHCRLSETQPEVFAEPAREADVDAASWAYLTRLMYRRLAPNTEASRMAGAGAGLSDND